MKRLWSIILTLFLVLSLLPMGVFTLTASADVGTMSAYADMRLTEITFTRNQNWCESVYTYAPDPKKPEEKEHSKDNPYIVTFEYHLSTAGRVTFGSVGSVVGDTQYLEGSSSTTLQAGRHTFKAIVYTTRANSTFAPRLTSTGNATLYLWNFSCTLGGKTLSGNNQKSFTTAKVNVATVSGFSWYDGEDAASEHPVTENAAILYNEKHSLYDEQAEELRQGIVNAAQDIQPSATGKTYYVSPDGSDRNDGLTPETAWRTTEAVAANAAKMKAGDVVLFKRGGVYRGTTRMVSGVSYGAYGTGPKPCLYASPRNYADANLWERFATNIWRVDVRYLTDIGNIVFEHGKICASDYKICDPNLMITANLKSNYQYYHDLENGYLYMYFNEGNPGTKHSSIEFCPDNHVFGADDYTLDTDVDIKDVTIDNLCIKYTGAHGIAFGHAENITVTNCEIGYIGGSMMNDEVRYGNGIEFYSHVTNALIENNWIYQCFDAGYTNQGSGSATHLNVNVKNNIIEYCNYNIEIFTGSEKGKIQDCTYEGNMLRFAGYGFGTNNRYGSNDSATSAICYWRRVIPSVNVVFRNNILDTSYRFLVVAAYVNDEQNRGPTFIDNVWVQHDGPKSAVALQVDTDVSGWNNHHLYELPSTDLATLEESVAKIDLNPTKIFYDILSVRSLPTKTVYKIGETLDTRGLTLTQWCSDGSTETITGGFKIIRGLDSATAGTKTVTVGYGDKTTTFTVVVAEGAYVIVQPQNVTTVANTKAKMSVVAKGEQIKYRWQVKTSATADWKNTTTSGYKTDTITIDATSARNGYQYRCEITDIFGVPFYTTPATLTVKSPKFTTQPKSVTAAKDAKPTFTVAATGERLKYQWQVKTSSSAAWKDSATTGYNTETITVKAYSSYNGYQYRCVITDVAGNTATSAAATLTVKSPKITTQPKSVTAAKGAKSTFTVAATGVGLKYQWQVRYSSTGTWQSTYVTGYNTKAFTVNATASVDGYQYRCVITDAAGNKVTSAAATLTVKSPKITTQPKSVTAAKNAKPTFTVAATGVGLKYQWQVKTSATADWKNTTVTGNKTKTITVTAYSSYNGYQYRCVITDVAGNPATSAAATLTVKSPKITSQPKSVTAAKNAKPTFTVAATGVGLKYQWQVKTSSSAAWKNTTVTGNKTKTITVTAYSSYNGYQYRCVITDAAGNKVTSSAVKLTVKSPKITTQPKSVTAAKNAKAKFTVAATGVGLKYQWQVKTSSSAAWKNTTATGNKTKTITVTAYSSYNGYQYRCVVTDAAGNKVTSSAVKLTVKSPKITTQPKSVTAAKNAKAKFTVAATGVGLKYQWQVKTSSSAAWKNTTATGNKTKTITVTAYSSYNGYQYRCVITDAAGNKVTSSAVKLTVKK